jgi:hypothetical protein
MMIAAKPKTERARSSDQNDQRNRRLIARRGARWARSIHPSIGADLALLILFFGR